MEDTLVLGTSAERRKSSSLLGSICPMYANSDENAVLHKHLRSIAIMRSEASIYRKKVEKAWI